MTPDLVATFSIVARDPDTGDLGVATASKFLAVGAVVPFARAGVGAGATQSYANTSVGPRTLEALAGGRRLPDIHQSYADTDPDHHLRQYGMVTADGDSLSFTGTGCHPWAGGVSQPGFAAQGNLLAGPKVLDALFEGYEKSHGPFPERMLASLLAGDRAGGDRRGRQAAALLVVREGGGYGGYNDRYIDLRVDDHPDPVPRLSELLELHRLFFERPRAEELLAIQGEVAERLSALLVSSGYLAAPGPWDAISERALRELAGVENLEERLVEAGKIDPRTLERLERVASEGEGLAPHRD